MVCEGFSSVRITNQVITVTFANPTQPIICDNITKGYNTGSYNTTTGIFTSPTDGIYIILAIIVVNNGAGLQCSIRLVLNPSTTNIIIRQTPILDLSATSQVFILNTTYQLSTNDELQLQLNSTIIGTYIINGNSTPLTCFSVQCINTLESNTILAWGAANSPFNDTYLTAWQRGGANSSEDNGKRIIIPGSQSQTRILQNARARVSTPPGIGEKFTLVVRVNSIDTSLKVIISDNNIIGDDLINEVNVTSGDIVSVRFDTTSGASFPGIPALSIEMK